ncbi:MAG: hypothetical protein AAF557_04450 [Pseudomonadota bacterium]
MTDLSGYRSNSGTFVPVWTLEIQTLPEDVDRILDAVMNVYPLGYGRYQRNASVSAVGKETAQPGPGSTTTTHVDGFEAGATETYPMVELKISIEREIAVLSKVMDAIHDVHHYEEPVIFLREDWTSRAAYNPQSDNPNRWWNNGRGLPKKTHLHDNVPPKEKS